MHRESPTPGLCELARFSGVLLFSRPTCLDVSMSQSLAVFSMSWETLRHPRSPHASKHRSIELSSMFRRPRASERQISKHRLEFGVSNVRCQKAFGHRDFEHVSWSVASGAPKHRNNEPLYVSMPREALGIEPERPGEVVSPFCDDQSALERRTA